MPAILESDENAVLEHTRLPFPAVTKEHILNCSYHSWHPKYRTLTPKSRLIPLTPAFLSYLRADGIILPSDDEAQPMWSDHDSGVFSASDNADAQEDDDTDEDIAAAWRDVHNTIKRTITNLDGRVVPKLNWSAPKDATWMNANSMECRSPDDIYLLLKSSDFITHDLEHAFDDTVESPHSTLTPDSVPYHLVLRKSVPLWNPAMEFRCFVRQRRLLCICQRDLNYFEFLSKMSARLRSWIQEFFDVRLRDTFRDESFVFDIYIDSNNRIWLVDINPWAPRTDPLLFSWMEILNMPDPPEPDVEEESPPVVRLQMGRVPDDIRQALRDESETLSIEEDDSAEELDSEDDDSEIDGGTFLPELRLVLRTDPEAYSFNSPQYSAHKLPKDVVDASQSGEGLREFAKDWQNILARRQQEDVAVESSDDD